VVEGVGDHGCEYMTGGVVVVLGETGRNFGAGMSGGLAYVYDVKGNFEKRFNPDMVGIERVTNEADIATLRGLLERHVQETTSPHAQALLDDWHNALGQFWKVVPHPDKAPAPKEKEKPARPDRPSRTPRATGMPDGEAKPDHPIGIKSADEDTTLPSEVNPVAVISVG
jgi:glutamate synthase (NADPH/NADH) large chain/glutamate synthase (ferredoxin)